jgi:hypothetical protein
MGESRPSNDAEKFCSESFEHVTFSVYMLQQHGMKSQPNILQQHVNIYFTGNRSLGVGNRGCFAGGGARWIAVANRKGERP